MNGSFDSSLGFAPYNPGNTSISEPASILNEAISIILSCLSFFRTDWTICRCVRYDLLRPPSHHRYLNAEMVRLTNISLCSHERCTCR